MERQMDATVNGGAKAWHARVRNLGLAAAVALVFSPLALPVADPVGVQAQQGSDECDFVTSGGFVVNPATGKKANFGVHGGCKNGGFWGHLNFVDHATGYHVNSVEVTAYLAPQGMTSVVRDVCGIASTNDPNDPEYVYFRARLVDNGEPGGADQFALKLGGTAVDHNLPLLQLGTARPGGNVQLHKANNSTALWPDNPTECGGLSFDAPPE